MVTKTPDILVAGDFFVVGATLDDADDMDINFGDVKALGGVIHTISHGGDCDVKLRLDSDGDGTVDQEVTLDSFTGEGISQGNEIEVGDQNDMTLRITDTSGGSGNDYIVTGGQL